MPGLVLTSKGVPLQLGRALGTGGEGTVFEVRGLQGRVAKLYHRCPDPRKQAKLRFMAARAEQGLLSCSAWPQETLHAAAGGPPVGFLMREAARGGSIHAVYSPAQRRQERPEADWCFLLCVARNTAAAFAALHEQGHVLGDVNQGNVVVGPGSRVLLIDCDSFQVNAGGTLFPCEVGVSHFTPPELQGLSSFDRCVRSVNHDNFGLALLVFHLLFGGRHPYSGVPLRSGVGEVLESDIQAFRYAYARDARRRGIATPPRALPACLVPPAVERMFHVAFTEAGASGRRPSAREWVSALDAIHGRLRRCESSPAHVFPDHLRGCPWCELESAGVVHFVQLGVACTRARIQRVVRDLWGRIEAIPPPPRLVLPRIDPAVLPPRPLPPGVPGPGRLALYRLLAVVFAIVLCAWAPQGWMFALIAGALAWGIAGSFATDPRRREGRRRRAALAAALTEYQQAVAAARRTGGPEGFMEKKAQLARVRHAYERSLEDERRELDAAGLGGSRQRVDLARNRVRVRFTARRAMQEAALRAGPAQLQRFAQAARQRVEAWRPRLEAASLSVAQAQRDLTAL